MWWSFRCRCCWCLSPLWSRSSSRHCCHRCSLHCWVLPCSSSVLPCSSSRHCCLLPLCCPSSSWPCKLFTPWGLWCCRGDPAHPTTPSHTPPDQSCTSHKHQPHLDHQHHFQQVADVLDLHSQHLDHPCQGHLLPCCSPKVRHHQRASKQEASSSRRLPTRQQEASSSRRLPTRQGTSSSKGWARTNDLSPYMTTSHTRTRLALLCSHTDIHPPANSQSRVTTWNQTQTAGRINVRQQGIKLRHLGIELRL